MGRLSSALRNRLVPAILSAIGVSLIAGGLLTFTGAAELNPASTSPSIISVAPTPTIALPTFPPSLGSPSPSASPTPVSTRYATRVVIQGLRIDIPVVKSPTKGVLCNVAMYYSSLVQPGIPGSTYIYAHARTGMFLPLLRASERNDGEEMEGMGVEVYTSDDQLYRYKITDVRRHVPRAAWFDDPISRTEEILWLQTSEGPSGTPTLLQVLAEPLTVEPADHAAANPKPRPVSCK